MNHHWQPTVLAPETTLVKDGKTTVRKPVMGFLKCSRCQTQVCQQGYKSKHSQLYYRTAPDQEWTDVVPECTQRLTAAVKPATFVASVPAKPNRIALTQRLRDWVNTVWNKYGVWYCFERVENGQRYNDGIKDDTIVYRVFYLNLTHHLILWLTKFTRSGRATGDCSLRLWSQEYTNRYHNK